MNKTTMISECCRAEVVAKAFCSRCKNFCHLRYISDFDYCSIHCQGCLHCDPSDEDDDSADT